MTKNNVNVTTTVEVEVAELPSLESIAETLKNRRIRLGVTQLELSEAAGVSQGTVVKLERNQSNPSYSNVADMVNALFQIEQDMEAEQ